MTNWPCLRVLELVAEIQERSSLSEAARSLSIPQPTASKSIAKLERQLGLQLLQRSTTGSRLTPDGERVAGWARDILTAGAQLSFGAESLRKRNRRLSLAATEKIAIHLLPEWLRAVRESQPTLQCDLEVGNAASILDGLRHGTRSLGFLDSHEIPRGPSP
ncbi:LysR family transcriptional regulator [Aeromicrobium sp. YIM 150415]|nr:LysR family transcriptional regulator [Aeromicrobium sp. YIM 150415]MBM9462431.1 LysR family transcriptional regulator [Aeromicrobium sp. YIM 150415]